MSIMGFVGKIGFRNTGYSIPQNQTASKTMFSELLGLSIVIQE